MARRKRQSGIATMWIISLLVPTFGMMGILTDVGWYYFATEQARVAAESAALASVRSAMDSVAGGATYTCGSGSITCQSPTACASTVPPTFTSNLQNGCAYAISNGFTNAGSQTVTIEAGTTTPAPTVPGIAVTYWATVRITQNNPLTFLAVFGQNTLGIGVRSTAAVIPAISSNCALSTDLSAAKSFQVSGGSVIDMPGCDLGVMSSSSDALDISGGASQLTANTVTLDGGYNNHGCTPCITPNNPTTGTMPSNPFSTISAPPFSSTCTYTNYNLKSGTATISQGTFCGGITVSGGTLNLNAGTYVLLGGGLTVQGGHTLNATSGVEIYNTCNPSPCAGGTTGYAPLTVSAGSTFKVTAASNGVAYLEDPTLQYTNQKDQISGGSSTCINGLVYAQTQLAWTGGSAANCNMQLVADILNFSGGSAANPVYLASSPNENSGPSVPTAFLIE